MVLDLKHSLAHMYVDGWDEGPANSVSSGDLPLFSKPNDCLLNALCYMKLGLTYIFDGSMLMYIKESAVERTGQLTVCQRRRGRILAGR